MNKSLLNKPGVYLLKCGDVILYIGSSANLALRPVKRDSGHKSRWAAILRSDNSELIPCESLTKARQLEEQLIIQHRPQFNLRTPHAEADMQRTWHIIQENW